MIFSRIKNNRVVHEIIWMAMISIIVSIFVVLIFHLYEIDLTTMIYVQEDACGAANVMHDYIVGIQSGHGLETLLRSVFTTNMEMNFFHKIGMFICCLFVDGFGTAVNLYYFSGYILVALGMYFAMRFMGVESWIAAGCGILYTFLPYHYLRGESHIFLACYYMVPLACAVIVRLMRMDEDKNKLFNISCIIIGILMGITDIYYSVFWAILLLFVSVFAFVHSHNIKKALYPLVLCAIPFLSLGMISLPHFIRSFTVYGDINSNFVLMNESERTLGDLLHYGLRISQLVYPIQNHRWGVLAEFRANLDQYLGNDETRMVSLGLLISIGFVISVVLALCADRKDTFGYEMRKYGLLNIYILLVAGIGGLNIFIGLFSSNIRCYNRMCIFIAAFSLMMIADMIGFYWNTKKRTVIIVVTCFFVCFGVWDQTIAFSQDDYIYNWELNNNMKTAVYEIDAMEEDGAHILMLPIILKNDSSVIHAMRNYEQSWNAVYSDNLQWIRGKDEENRQWLSALSVLPTREILPFVALEDVNGIWLDENGYAPDEFEDVKKALDETLGLPVVISKSGKQYYYTLKNYRKQFLDAVSEDELDRLKCKNEKMYTDNGYYVGVSELKTLNDKEEMVDNMLVLENGSLQYGPFLPLKKGFYQLTIVGNNLMDADFQIYYEGGTQNIDYSVVENKDDKWLVSFKLVENVDNMEFVLSNSGDESITLNYYYLQLMK